MPANRVFQNLLRLSSAAVSVLAACTIAAACGAEPSSAAIGTSNDQAVLDGVYRWEITTADAVAHGIIDDMSPPYLVTFPWRFVIEMADGVWVMSVTDARGETSAQCADECTYTLDGGEVTFVGGHDAETHRFSFTTDEDGTLRLRPFGNVSPSDAFVWITEPWERID